MKINLGLEFGRYPAGRYLTDGPYSGQKFREDFLIPALNGPDEEIEIVLSDARGLKSSFLEEAFGGLVRAGFDANALIRRFKFVSRDPSLEVEIHDYIRAQDRT
jgi:hypothetical protein